MLVIKRKVDEAIFIGGADIKITVTEISKDRVKIGVDAPDDVKIYRGELYDTEKFNVQAALNKPSCSFLDNIMGAKNNRKD